MRSLTQNHRPHLLEAEGRPPAPLHKLEAATSGRPVAASVANSERLPVHAAGREIQRDRRQHLPPIPGARYQPARGLPPPQAPPPENSERWEADPARPKITDGTPRLCMP